LAQNPWSSFMGLSKFS